MTPVTVAIETELGTIEAEIDASHAPVTAANFLTYVDRGWYGGGQFHRTVKPDNQPDNTVKIEVIQGGLGAGTPSFPAIALERTTVTGLSHRDGTLSMARDAADTATSDFFICIGDQPRDQRDGSGAENSGCACQRPDTHAADPDRAH